MKRVSAICLLFVSATVVPQRAMGISSLFFCSEPERPWCLDHDFNDITFDRCRFEVEQFVKNTKSFIECLNDSSEKASKAAKKAVETFNCKADRRLYCD